MSNPDLDARISELSDVDLVRLLTVDAAGQTPDVLAAAEAEANRRGVPIDEAFIPAAETPESVETEPAEDADSAPSRFSVGDRMVTCHHCGGQKFTSKEVLFNTRGLTFFNLDWLNRSATALVCTNCTLVQLFMQPPVPEGDEAA